MNIREMTEALRRAEEEIVFWKNSSAIRQKKLLEKDKEIERLNNIIDELEKIFKDYGTKEDIVDYSMYYISGETIVNILDKLKELKGSDKE